MASDKPVCLVCGKDLVYEEAAREFTCAVCGGKELGHTACEDGHYVCNACHRRGGVEVAYAICRESSSKNPVEILQQIMNDKAVYPNGPEHHTAIGMALLSAYKNSGGDIDLEGALDELRARSLQVPGGACGYWGTCGAATSAGQYWSVVTGSTPLNEGPWEQCARLTSRVLGHIADVGGVRCCKRTGFIALIEARAHTEELLGVRMEMPERIVCTHFPRNKQCLHAKCPFFPRNKEELEAQREQEASHA